MYICTARVNDLSNGKRMRIVVSLHEKGVMGIPELSETENKNGTNNYEFHYLYMHIQLFMSSDSNYLSQFRVEIHLAEDATVQLTNVRSEKLHTYIKSFTKFNAFLSSL